MEIQAQTKHCDPIVDGLIRLLDSHKDKRICVVGTTCTGKSTMLTAIPGARDQDAEVFPMLTKAEADYVCKTPWTEEIGRAMSSFVRERVRSKAGHPVFGTVVIDCDLVVLLKISDALLERRCAIRSVNFADAKNMQVQLEQELARSGISSMVYEVG